MNKFSLWFLLLSMMLVLQSNAQSFRFDDSGDGELTVIEGDQPVLVYLYGMQSHPDAPNRTRSSYIHPLYGMDGEILTDDFPKDHYHHRGVFWTWVNVYWNNKHLDFWTLNQDHVREKFEKWRFQEIESNSARFGVDNGWYVGDTRIVDEKVDITVHPSNKVGRAIDIKLSLNAVDQDVTLTGAEGKGYSGFGIRFNEYKDLEIATSSGLHTMDSLRVRSRWADYSAIVKGQEKHSGVSTFIHPDHPDFPPGWFLRHYGYYGVCWPSLNKYTLKAEDPPVVLQYRLWVHRGDAEAGKVQQAFDEYYQEMNP